MKPNAPRRKIFDDAIDVLTGIESSPVTENGVVEIPIERIVPFRDHPFHLYEGERLQDMVESIKSHGILTPIIVRQDGERYEILAGHNRTTAARLAGLAAVPAIVKTDISDDEAYVYVIETNLMQRSFSDFMPSEKAVILEARYEKEKCQGKRSDIIREIAKLQGEETSGLIGQKTDRRSDVGAEYGLSSKSVARLLRLNHLIPAFKAMVDNGILPIYAAVDLSFISEQAQGFIYDASKEFGLRINMKTAGIFRSEGDNLTQYRIRALAKELTKRDKPATSYQNVKLPKVTYKKYFKDMDESKIQAIIQVALDAYFADKK